MSDAGSPQRLGRARILILLAALALLAAGCAPPRERWLNPHDPLQPVNRAFFGFNMALDRGVAQPASTVYRGLTPKPVRRAVGNFFNNLSLPFVIVNDLLQGELEQGASDFGRLAVNTTLGVAGFADPATDLGLPKYEQHFAATAGVWGLGPGPYLVLPVFGPTPLVGLPDIPLRILLNPIAVAQPAAAVQTTAVGVGAVSEAESRREAMQRVRNAVEPYSFMRSGVMQRQWEYIQRARDGQAGETTDPFDPIPEELLEQSAMENPAETRPSAGDANASSGSTEKPDPAAPGTDPESGDPR